MLSQVVDGSKWYNITVGNLCEVGGDGDAWQTYDISLPCKKGQTINYAVWGANVIGELNFVPMR